jgi:hypothetical protein
MRSAWIENDIIRDIAPDANPQNWYTPDIAAHYNTPVPDNAKNGDSFAGGVLTPRPVPVYVAPSAPAAPTTTVMKAVLWYNCFTPTEAKAIKASTDPLVEEFYFRLQQLIAAGETIDTSLTSVQEGVDYLVSQSIITLARAPQILLGVLQ